MLDDIDLSKEDLKRRLTVEGLMGVRFLVQVECAMASGHSDLGEFQVGRAVLAMVIKVRFVLSVTASV